MASHKVMEVTCSVTKKFVVILKVTGENELKCIPMWFSKPHREDCTYYTSAVMDAIGTAKHMLIESGCNADDITGELV